MITQKALYAMPARLFTPRRGEDPDDADQPHQSVATIIRMEQHHTENTKDARHSKFPNYQALFKVDA